MKTDRYRHLRKWLGQYYFITREIAAREEHLRNFREELYHPLRASATGDLPKGGGASDPTAKRVLDIQALYETMMAEMETVIQELYAVKTEIEQVVAQLEPAERCVIYHRYILGIIWSEMPDYIGYETSQCHRLENAALKKIAVLRQVHAGDGMIRNGSK